MSSGTDKVQPVSRDLQSDKEHVVADPGLANRPSSDSDPGVRFSLSPDGKSLAYAIRKRSRILWMLEGFPQRPPRAVIRLPMNDVTYVSMPG